MKLGILGSTKGTDLQAIFDAINKRKKELMIPPKLKILPWLNLINPKIVDFLVKQKMLEQDSE